MEQEEYKREKIAWDNVTFTDNLLCIELIESPNTKSVFKYLDEECMLNGNETNLLKKMND